MPSPLIIPGVQVKTILEPSPSLPSLTGILGVVGVTDRGPLTPTPVGSMGEFVDIFGPASRFSMPKVRAAFGNGVSRMVIARTSPGPGTKASLGMLGDEGETVATLIARAEGQWGNALSVRATQVKTLGGLGVKYVNLEVSLDGQLIESFSNLNLDEDSPDYLFDRINSGSRVIVAEGPVFQTQLPAAVGRTALTDSGARAAFAVLNAGATGVIRVEAKQTGHRGVESDRDRPFPGRVGRSVSSPAACAHPATGPGRAHRWVLLHARVAGQV